MFSTKRPHGPGMGPLCNLYPVASPGDAAKSFTALLGTTIRLDGERFQRQRCRPSGGKPRQAEGRATEGGGGIEGSGVGWMERSRSRRGVAVVREDSGRHAAS